MPLNFAASRQGRSSCCVANGSGAWGQPWAIDPRLRSRVDDCAAVEDLAADFIAGMTDRYAIDEYQRLYDPTTRV